jgi:predicted nucleic acid-binding protein
MPWLDSTHGRLSLRLTGTLGVLLQAKQAGLLPAVSPILDRLQELRFRMDPETRQAVLRLAGEQ